MLLISDIKTSDGNFEVNLAVISRKGHVESASGKRTNCVYKRNCTYFMLLISDIKTSDGNFEVNIAVISRKGHVESASGKRTRT